MNNFNKCIIFLGVIVLSVSSCSTLEKSSTHGFNSGNYKLQTKDNKAENVYVDIKDETLDVYPLAGKKPEKNKLLTISLIPSESMLSSPVKFSKKSLDIDITSIIFKYHPVVYGLQGQLNTDFNIALFAGYRHDNFNINGITDPFGNGYNRISNWGYDFGFFAGLGSTPVSPFTTQNQIADEYSGLIIQTGFAGFIESNIASFGLSIGYDHLMNSDRDVWIYTNKPWVGFIVGIALN